MKQLTEHLQGRLERLHEDLGISRDSMISSELVQRLITYTELLQRWTKRVDLVAPADLETLLERHIVDSYAALLISRRAIGDCSTLGCFLDIGSGAGLPGLVFAICEKNSHALLCEPREKRTYFLKQAVLELGLENVTVLRSRAEEVFETQPAPSLIFARAVGNDQLLIDTARRVGQGDILRVLQLSGPNFENSSNLEAYAIHDYQLCPEGPARKLVEWRL